MMTPMLKYHKDTTSGITAVHVILLKFDHATSTFIVCRYSQYYYEDGVQKRILTKAYGILFKLDVYGMVCWIPHVCVCIYLYVCNNGSNSVLYMIGRKV